MGYKNIEQKRKYDRERKQKLRDQYYKESAERIRKYDVERKRKIREARDLQEFGLGDGIIGRLLAEKILKDDDVVI